MKRLHYRRGELYLCVPLFLLFLFALFSIPTSSAVPSVIWVSQVPPDINSTNVIGEPLNITYNITDPSAVNLSSILIFFKTNSTTSDCLSIVNGTEPICGWMNMTYTENTSADDFLFRLLDNEIYPALYNFPEQPMETTPHLVSPSPLTASNRVLKIEILNVSNSKRYGFFEVMANTSGTRDLNFYYCNSSYVSGTVFNSPYCTSFYIHPATATYDHVHTNYSSHLVAPFAMNLTTGEIGGVYVTSTSYFIIRPTTGPGSWNYYYLSNVSRADAIQTSSNTGNSWSDFAGTVDAHLHQYESDDTLHYYVCAEDNLSNLNCSALRNDSMELAGIPPTSPSIYSPTNTTYCGNISINYTESISPNGYDISFYNITLLNSDGTFNKTITANNSLNLSYLWNANETAPGEYVVRVDVCDVLDQCSYGLSEIFNFTGPCIYNCPVITAPGDYIQTMDYAGAPNDASPLSGYACVEIAASNVLYDCAGYNITDNGTSSSYAAYGILLNGSLNNITIRNCPSVSNYTYGVYAYQSENVSIGNVTSHNNTETGFVFDQANRSSILGCTAYNNTKYGFRSMLSNYTVVANSTIRNNVDHGALISSGGYCAFTNNTMHSNGGHGISLDTGVTNCTFTNNTAYSNAKFGMLVQISPANNFTGTNLSFNGWGGIALLLSQDCNFNRSEIYGNSLYGGFSIISSNNTRAYSTHLYNNSPHDAWINSSASDMYVYFYNLTIDNPLGNYTNYTVLNITDVVTSGTSYTLRWAVQPAALPVVLENFHYKYVNISNTTGTVSIDSIWWHWLDSEVGVLDESKLGLWKYNSSWALLNGTPDTVNNLLSLSSMDPDSTYGILSDTYPPNVSFVAPTQNSGTITNSSYVEINVTANDSSGISNITVYLYNSTGALINSSNSTSSPLFSNFTGLPDGVYYFNATAYDTMGNYNSTETRNVTIDTIAPGISIGSPTNGTSYNYSNISINYTAYDQNPGSCWYVLNGSAPVALPNCLNTSLIFGDGQYNLTIFVNDTAGNTNSSTVQFLVDATAPAIAIQSPANTSYNVFTVDLNFTASDPSLDACWYALDSNPAVYGCANATLGPLAAGQHNVTVFANDTFGNTNSSTVFFTINRTASICSLSFDPASLNETYGTLVTATCSCTNPEASAILWRNGTDANAENGVPTLLPGGTWNYVCNVTETQNYTNASNSSTYTINPATPALALSADPGWSATNGTQTNVSCDGNPALLLDLYRNGSLVDSSYGHAEDVSTLAPGSYFYECNTTGNENYTSASASNTLTITTVPPPTPRDGGDKRLSVQWSRECPEGQILITATYNSRPVEDVRVRLLLRDPYAGLIDTQYTDRDGEVVFSVSENGTYEADFRLAGYEYNNPLVIRYTACPEVAPPVLECNASSGCSSNEFCEAGECRPVVCECGIAENHGCTPYECCSDSDCGEGFACENNECMEIKECETDADCTDDRHCSEGACVLVPAGECGYVASHAWHGYECCVDEGCAGYPYEYCEEHACLGKQYVLQLADEAALVAGQEAVLLLLEDGRPMPNAFVKVVSPSGAVFEGYTDANGNFRFTPDVQGRYDADAIGSAGRGLASLSVTAQGGAAPKCCFWGWCGLFGFIDFLGICWYWWILPIILLIIAYKIYRTVTKKEKEKPKRPEQPPRSSGSR